MHEETLKRYGLFIEEIKSEWEDGGFINKYKVYNDSIIDLAKKLRADLVSLQYFLIDFYKQKITIPEYSEVSINKADFITFHQSYSYEDFIEGLRAETDEKGNISYYINDGIFKDLCIKAFNSLLEPIGSEKTWEVDSGVPELDDDEKDRIKEALDEKEECPRYYLVIDEINRGNISKIFGELITLLEKDKRIGADNELIVTLPYSGERFGVPPNLYVIGTMNSTDRSIALIDTALRRRFSFMELEPDPDLVPETIGDIQLRDIFNHINKKIEILKDRDHRIGHSYLMDKPERQLKTIEDLKQIWFSEIIPLLQEHFYNEPEKLLEILGDGFVDIKLKKEDIEKIIKNRDYFVEDREIYSIKKEEDMDNEAFREAMKNILGGNKEEKEGEGSTEE